MKPSSQKLITTAILTLSLAVSAFAMTPKSSQSSKINWKQAEKNYITALCSDNVGLRHSATNFLAEYRLPGAVQPLIEVLHEDKVEQVRMAAALALVQIGSKEGVDAVKEAALYDGSEKVAKFCEQLISTSSSEFSLK